jgi:hypothetical protein
MILPVLAELIIPVINALSKLNEALENNSFTENSDEAEREPPSALSLEVKAVYLASCMGFSNYCKGCMNPVKTESVKSSFFAFRIFCSVDKCIK